MDDLPKMRPARELSPEEAQARAEECYEVAQAIIASLRVGRAALWETARHAHAFNELRGWGPLGYDSLAAFLAEPDVGWSQAGYYRAVEVYEHFIHRRGMSLEDVADIPLDKIAITMSAMRQQVVSPADAVADARALGWRDLQDKYLGERKRQRAVEDSLDPPVPAGYVPENPTDDVPMRASDAPLHQSGEGEEVDAEVVPDVETVVESDVDPTDEEAEAVAPVPALDPPALQDEPPPAGLVADLEKAIESKDPGDRDVIVMRIRSWMRSRWGI